MLAAIVRRLPSDPIVLSVITAIGILIALVVHAYYDTRKQQPARHVERTLPEIKPLSEKALEESALLREAPDVLILDYTDDGTPNFKIKLYNDGKESAYDVRFGPIRIVFDRMIHSNYPMSPIPSKHYFPVNRLTFDAECPLFKYLKEQVPNGAVATVEMLYTNQSGRGFTKEFRLGIAADEQLYWQPQPVKLQEPLTATKA